MTATLLIVTGVLFLFESAMGLFHPGIYRFVEPRPRAGHPAVLPAIGSLLGLWGVACLGGAIPPGRPAHWFLIAVGLACVHKGVRMIAWPGSLHDTPDYIRTHPGVWRARSVFRGAIGVGVITWGTLVWGG